MRNFLVRIMCCFIPIKKWRHSFRRLHIHGGVVKKDENMPVGSVVSPATESILKPVNAQINWSKNHIWLIAQDGTRRLVTDVPNCKFEITGENNNIYLYEPVDMLTMNVKIQGNTNITIFPVRSPVNLIIIREYVNSETSNIIIGENLWTTGPVTISISNGGAGDVIIGKDCLFSWGIGIRTGDWHTIYDENTGAVLNYNDRVVIGNHVWVGSDVLFLKGACVADNSVVGARSVVTRKFDEQHVAIAGMPAKIVKRNINWDKSDIAKYEEQRNNTQ